MTNTEILSKYNKQSRQLSKLFSWLDENEIQLDEICKEDVKLFFKVNPGARNTGRNIKQSLKQVLQGEGLPYEWVQTVIVPFQELWYSLDDVLKTVDDFAQGIGQEIYKVEANGFDSVKAAIILLWIGLPSHEAGYLLKEDVCEDCVRFIWTEFPYIGNISDFMMRYKKSDGYFCGNKPRLRFMQYKDEEYFLRTVKTASRDKIVKRLFERVADLDITINDIQKAGLFDRVYQDEKNKLLLVSDGLMPEYEAYKKKRLAIR